MLLIEHVESFKLGSIRPILNSLTMFLAMSPLASVHVARLAVDSLLHISGISVRLALSPAALNSVSIRLGVFSDTMGQIILPLSFIDGAVSPDLFAMAIFLVINPLSFVDTSGLRTVVLGTDFTKRFIAEKITKDKLA